MQHRRDPAALQYHQYITAVQRQRGVVQADQRGLAAGVDQLRQQRGHPAAVRKVKRTVRLVQQKQRRILGNRARQNTELLLAAAQRQVVLPGLVGQTYGAQGLVRSGAHGGGGALQDPQPRVEAHKHDLPRRERDRDAALLRDIADGLRKPAGGQTLQRDAVQKALPGVGQQPGGRLEQRGLAAAVYPQQPDQLPGHRDRKADPLQHGCCAVPYGEVLHAKPHGRGRGLWHHDASLPGRRIR